MRRLALLSLLTLIACDTGSVERERYPPPGEYPDVALAELLTIDPGRYNTTGVVTAFFECPPNTDCLVPDTVTLEEPNGGSSPVSVDVLANEPSQFQVGATYRVSVEVTGEPGAARQIMLLGFERVD